MTASLRFLLLAALCLALSPVYAGEPPRVIASIKPIHSLLAGIMQGVAEPTLLMDGSQAPSAYRPDSSQIKALSEADLIVWSGAELSPGLGEALRKSAPKGRVLELLSSDELKILPSRGGERLRDAFFWLDSRNMLILLDELTRLLMEIDPQNAQRYERNRSIVLGPIAEGDRVMEYAYRDVSSIGVFFYHDTHQYFEQAYAMKIVGHVASPPGSTSGNVNGVIALKNWLAESPQPCLFTEYAYEEPHLDLLLANSDVTPIELDSLGSQLPPGPDLYVQLMQRNFSAISNCVEGLKPEQKKPRSQASNSPDAALFPSEVTPRYLLIDQDGDTVTNSDFLGQFQLIYFGYTYCPDICPTSLSHLAQAMQLLGPQADEVQPLFITVDPERDTPQVLQRYVSYFHPRLLGLSGSPAITKRTAENFKAPFEKVPSESGDPQRYSMDHSAGLYLIGRNGEFLTKFAHGFPADKMAERIRAYMRDAG